MKPLFLFLIFLSFGVSAKPGQNTELTGEAQLKEGQWFLSVVESSSQPGKDTFLLQGFPPANLKNFKGKYLYGAFSVDLVKCEGKLACAKVKSFEPKVNDPLAKMPELDRLREIASENNRKQKEKGFQNGP